MMSVTGARDQIGSGESADADWLDRLITEQEAAAFLGLSVRFMQNRRVRGGGPPYVRISGRCIRYRRRDLTTWADACLEAHTSQRLPHETMPAESGRAVQSSEEEPASRTSQAPRQRQAEPRGDARPPRDEVRTDRGAEAPEEHSVFGRFGLIR